MLVVNLIYCLRKNLKSMSKHRNKHTTKSQQLKTLILPQQLPLNQKKKSPKTSSQLSLQVMLSRFNPPQITSHQLTKTLLREDMLQFSSPLLPRWRLFTPCMKTLLIFNNCTTTPSHSGSSLKTLVLVLKKFNNSMLAFLPSVNSTH